MAKILVAEDDQASREFLTKFLKRESYNVIEAQDGATALKLAPQADLVLLDVMMPKLTGWQVAEIIKEDFPDLPFIMLTALASLDDQLQGFDLGADDYITKPYDLRALGARVKSLLRRVGVKDDLVFDGLHIHLDSRDVSLSGKSVSLSKVEFDLLSTLASYPGKIFSREHLLDRIWGSDYFGTDRVVDVRMVSLRKKLNSVNSDLNCIETIRGLGYRFRVPS